MKCILLASTVVVVVLSGSCTTSAQPRFPPPMIAAAPIGTGISYAVSHRHVRIFDRRKLGMPCVMPPDMQVVLSWPGPACAYTDNFIFLPHR
jgi:hypothetical protein